MSQSLARAGARGGATTILAQLVVLIIKAATIVVLARLITPTEFGIAAVATSIATFFTSIVLMGLGMAAVQSTSLSQRAKSALFFINVGVGLVSGLLLVLLGRPIADVYGYDDLASLMPWLALAPVFTGLLSQPRVHLVRDLRFSLLAITDIVSTIGAFVATVFVAVAGFGITALIVQFILQPALQFAMIVCIARWIPTNPFGAGDELRRLITVGFDIFGMNLATNVTRTALVPIVGLTASPGPLGQFDRAQQIVNLPVSLIVDQLQRVAVPVLSRLRDDPQRFASYLARSQMLVAYIVALGFAWVVALATPLTTIVLGSGWELAAIVLQWLALSAVFRTLVQTTRWAYIAFDRTRDGLILNSWAQPAVLALSCVGLPWGIVGVGIAHAAAWCVVWPVVTTLTARAVQVRATPLYASAMRAMLVGLAAGAAGWSATLLALSELVEVGIGTVFGSATVALIALVVPGVRRDVAALIDTARRLKW